MPSAIDVLLIGHMTVDLVPGGRMLGGTISYAAPTYAAFGHSVGIVTSAALNEPLLGQLEPFGQIHVVPSDESLTYENVYDECGRRQYVRATAQDLRYADIPAGWITAPYVHMGPLAAEIDPLELADNLHAATIMLTLQGMMRRWENDSLVRFRRWFDRRALERIDIVIFSREDIVECPQLTDEMRRVCKHLVVTNGRNGGIYYHDGGAMHYDSIPVDPLDLTGAGDVFAASLLAALPKLSGDVASAVRVAGRLAAYSVTRSGLDSAPTPAEIESELSRISGDT
ncbi:MAG: PfkB family carbohydrate kinase [Chloroflexi bacterium]|nr:PfkB family carbohydrate kinase [Chloroflexota bacterium]